MPDPRAVRGSPGPTYLVPDQPATWGHGVWLGRQVCDSLEVACDAPGTHMGLLTLLPNGAAESVP